MITRSEIIDRACELAPQDGLIIECGVAGGKSLRQIANKVAPRFVYGFDSFAGLPEQWGSYTVGHFACTPPQVPANAWLFIGLFEDTLPRFLTNHSEKIALLHIDCDLYSSTKTVLETLQDRITVGTIILMDEFYILTEHEQRAFMEFCRDHIVHYRIKAHNSEQCCVQVTYHGR